MIIPSEQAILNTFILVSVILKKKTYFQNFSESDNLVQSMIVYIEYLCM